MWAPVAQIRIDPIVTWEPPPPPPLPGTWPYHWYDSGKPAANPHASPPTAPEAVWQTAIPGEFSGEDCTVVGPNRVDASGVQVTAISRQNGTVNWQKARPPGLLVVDTSRTVSCIESAYRSGGGLHLGVIYRGKYYR